MEGFTHKYDNKYVEWLLFFAMKTKSRDTDEWRRENYHNASLREIRVRKEYNEQILNKKGQQ